MRTDLHHDHAESEYVCFACDRTDSLEDLWCGPRRQMSVAVKIDENVELARGYQWDPKLPEENTCPI